jgi:pimeloyl-ACP methyl ester carboxylesterase
VVPAIYGEAFLKRIQRARLILLAGASHMLAFEKSDELVEVVTDFLLVQ